VSARARIARGALLFGAIVRCASGCASSEPNGNAGSAGTGVTGTGGSTSGGNGGGQAGATGQGGVAGDGAGGSSAGIAGRGGSSAGSGVAGSAGAAGSSGGSSAGATAGRGGGGGGAAGSGGSASAGRGGATAGTAGSAGSAGTAGAGGSSSGAPMPSAGCGKSGRPSGGMVQVANTSLYMFPTGYDGTKPFPLLIALHACGNPNTEFVSLTNNTGFATDYVRSFPNTPDSGQCWNSYSGDVARILSQYDEVVSNYCIDLNRVFATAHSSGAQMLVNILSHKADAQHLNLSGIAPVAADPYNVAIPMPVMYIDGKMDNQRSPTSASDTVARFRTANMCASTSQPFTSVAMCQSTDSGRPTVDPGCIIYDGCTVPTIWCSHNDPSYSGTEHGVPCFAMKAMYDFFAGLP
jgi:poly(3-hydroxybutyrate) depolymerase